MPTIVVLLGSLLYPIKWTSSPTLTLPYSTVPVATVPLPAIVNVPSTDKRNGRSLLRGGNGILVSIDYNNSSTLYSPNSVSVSLQAAKALPLITIALSPSYSYYDNISLTSISTNSCNSSSLTTSHLLINTIIVYTPTYLHNKTCSLVYGIAPSVADTTNIPQSILAAPVIIFLT